MLKHKRLIDISQPVKSDTAVFPGDTAFRRNLTLSYETSGVVNLTAFTMSPHVGTHVDAPAHIKGDMSVFTDLAGSLALEPFIGPALLLDLSPKEDAVSWADAQEKLELLGYADAKTGRRLPERVLLRTQKRVRYDVFEDEYAFFSTELVTELAARGVRLIGIDTPSADNIRSKTLEAHHELDRLGMLWLENLDLSEVSQGEYYLIAFPIKFMELEASPVRAVLLEF